MLVTGASGFVGRHVGPALLERGYDVHATSFEPGPADSGGMVWHQSDLCVDGEAGRLLARVRPTHLVHLAWTVEPGAFWTSHQNLAWIGTSLDLLRGFVEMGGRRAVVAGTCAEYRWGDDPLSEGRAPVEPSTLYGASKDALRRAAAAFFDQEHVELAWGRVFFMYGPHEPSSRLVSSVAVALLQGQVARCSSGTARRDFLHVADVGDAFAALLDSRVCGAVNIASGEAVSLRHVIERVATECGRPELVALGSLPDRAQEPPIIRADVTRLCREVEWTPRRSLSEGLADTVAWWKATLGERTPIRP